jgi:hypothetical protein
MALHSHTILSSHYIPREKTMDVLKNLVQDLIISKHSASNEEASSSDADKEHPNEKRTETITETEKEMESNGSSSST